MGHLVVVLVLVVLAVPVLGLGERTPTELARVREAARGGLHKERSPHATNQGTRTNEKRRDEGKDRRDESFYSLGTEGRKGSATER